MNQILSASLLVIAIVGIYRAWIFYVLKTKSKATEQSPSFGSFLMKDFGNVNNLLIWYIKDTHSNSEINRLIKKVNLLTTVFVVLLIFILVSFLATFFFNL